MDRRPAMTSEQKVKVAVLRENIHASFKGSMKKIQTKLTKEEREEVKRQIQYRKEDRMEARREKECVKKVKLEIKRELAILEYMLKTDVLYYHHGTSESLKEDIKKEIREIKSNKIFNCGHVAFKRNSYIWNYQDDNDPHYGYISRSLLGNLWRGEFDTIYDVPLDGTYVLQVYDSGHRGSGTFDHMTVRRVENQPIIPHVEPGGFPQITIN